MATIDDVRALALALPGVEEKVGGHTGEAAWRCNGGQPQFAQAFAKSPG